MAEIKKTGGRTFQIIYDESDFISGMHPQYSTNTTAFTKGGEYIGFARSFDPYRFLGYASPGYDNTALTNASQINAKPLNIAVNGANAYIVGSSSKINRLVVASETITNDTAGTGWPHTTAHTSLLTPGAHSGIEGSDFVMYTANIGSTPTLQAFYSFYDTTDWDVGAVTSLTASPNTFDDDFMSTVPTNFATFAGTYAVGGKSTPHPMIVGDDDRLIIGDRNFVHAYDGAVGANGTFQAAVLTLPNNYIITAFAKLDNLTLVVFASNNSSTTGGSFYGVSKAYFWDYLSTDPWKVIDLNDNFVSCAFEYEGTIGCFTEGRSVDFTTSKVCKLNIFDGSEFSTVAIFTSNAPTKGGVDIRGRDIQWLSLDNGANTIYSFGNENQNNKTLQKRAELNSSSNSGLLRTISSTLTIAGAGDTSAGTLVKVSSNYYDQSTFSTALIEPPLPDRQKARICYITIEYGKASSGGRSLSLFVADRSNNTIQFTNAITAVTSDALLVRTQENVSGVDLRAATLATTGSSIFDALRLTGSWSSGSGATDAPIVSRVIVDCEYINI